MHHRLTYPIKVIERWILPVLGAVLVLIYMVTVFMPDRRAPTQVIQTAERCIEITAENRFNATGLGALLAQPWHEPPADCWQTVTLPDRVPSALVTNLSQPQPLRRAWFRFKNIDTGSVERNGELLLYVPRVAGGNWQIWVNGQALTDNRSDWRMTFLRPASVRIPASLMATDRPLDVRVAIAFHPSLGFSLSRVYAGTETALRTRMELREFIEQTVPAAASYILLAMSGLFFLFWLARRTENIYLLLSLAGVGWTVFDLQYILHRHDNEFVNNWYDAIGTLSTSWVMWLMLLFSLRLDTVRVRGIESLLAAFVLLSTFVLLPIWPANVDFDVLYLFCANGTATIVTLFITWRAWQSRKLEQQVISVSLLIALGCGVNDIRLYAQQSDPENLYLLPLSTTLVFGALLFSLLCRYIRALNTADAYNAQLEQRLEEKTLELQSQHQRLREVERNQAVLLERQRLMHDMHDGLGSALMSTLVAVEHGRLPQDDVAQALRDCIADLRLVIDSLEPLGHDLTLLLATLRHRLEHRLLSAGLTLDWQVHDLPTLTWLESAQALQVMRIIQEILTNVVKHSQASIVRIGAHHDADAVIIEIEDNGCGFDTQRGYTGRGLKHLYTRSQALHGVLHIDSVPGKGTRVTLRLPIASSELTE